MQIDRLEHDPKWALEVINEDCTSTTWDDLFDSDDEAFAAFQKVVEEEGIESFLDNANVIPFPKRWSRKAIWRHPHGHRHTEKITQ